MRFKGIAISAAGVLAAGAFGVVSGVHNTSVFAACSATGVSGTTAEVDSPTGNGCLQAGVGVGSGVVYDPVGGGATAGVPGVYVIAQGTGNNPCINEGPVATCGLHYGD